MGAPGRNLTRAAIICALVFLVVTITLNALWRRSFFYDGIVGIRYYQEHSKSPVLTYGYNLISKLFASGTFMLIAFLVYCSQSNKIPMLSFLIYFYTKNYLIYVGKMAFMDPRPFWATTAVKQLEWGCPDQFGNPSGHSSSVFLFSMLVYDVVLRRDSPILFLMATLIGLTVPMSRLYLGAHSTNQVVLGMLLEIICLVLYRYNFQAVIYNLINTLLSRKNLKQLLWIVIAYATALFIPYLVYQLEAQNPTSQPLIQNMLIGCPHSKTHTGFQMLTRAFEVSGFAGLIFGILTALWLSERENYRYLYGQWRYTGVGIVSLLARVMLESALSLVAYWSLGIYLPIHLRNTYLRFFARTLGMFLTGFLTLLFSRRLLLSSQVIYEVRIVSPPYRFPEATCC